MVKKDNYFLLERENGLRLSPKNPDFPYTIYGWRILDEDPNKNWVVEKHTGVIEIPYAIVAVKNSKEAYFRAYENAINSLKKKEEKTFRFFDKPDKNDKNFQEGRLVQIAHAFDFLVDNHPEMVAYVGCGQLTNPI